MASTRSRQRKLERDRYERQMVRRAQQQRRRRRFQAGIGAFAALALIVVGSAWLLGGFDQEEEAPPQADLCTWMPQPASANPERLEVGTPPANPPETGTRTMTVELDAGSSGAGTVRVDLDVAEAPCAAASLQHLADQGFYDDTVCHELTDSALRCGDPGGTGAGGPTYSFLGENPPEPQPVETGDDSDGDDGGDGGASSQLRYPAGTVALGDPSGDNSSQFLIFFEDFTVDAPLFSIVGTVTSGLDVVEAIGAAGTAEGEGATPVEQVGIRSLTVTDPAAAPTDPEGTGEPSPAERS